VKLFGLLAFEGLDHRDAFLRNRRLLSVSSLSLVEKANHAAKHQF
jgi:hypothetical protein